LAVTLIIAIKTITTVFGTMALQLTEVFQCIVTYSMKRTSLFFWLLQCFYWFHCVWLQLYAIVRHFKQLQNLRMVMRFSF